eukprot:7116960-Pyramimonas_sp.AAC.1
MRIFLSLGEPPNLPPAPPPPPPPRAQSPRPSPGPPRLPRGVSHQGVTSGYNLRVARLASTRVRSIPDDQRRHPRASAVAGALVVAGGALYV